MKVNIDDLEFEIIGPGDATHQITWCDYCNYRFNELDDIVQTVNSKGPVTLCRECYRKAGNSVR